MSQRFSVMVALLATISISTAAFAGSRILIKDNQKVTRTCKRGDTIVVMGNRNQVTVKGPCARIDVMGNRNKIVTKKAAQTIHVQGNRNDIVMMRAVRISVTGNKNTVSWRYGATARRPPRISNLGKNNKIKKARILKKAP